MNSLFCNKKQNFQEVRYIAAAAKTDSSLKGTTCDLRFHLWIYYNAWSNLTKEIQFLEFMGGFSVPQAFPNYLICLRFIRISMVTHDTIYPNISLFVNSYYSPCSLRLSLMLMSVWMSRMVWTLSLSLYGKCTNTLTIISNCMKRILGGLSPPVAMDMIVGSSGILCVTSPC